MENLLNKLPITLDSFGAKNRQNKLYKELDEIEKAIITFSKNKVFVKIDSWIMKNVYYIIKIY